MRKKKVMAVASAGGHWAQLLRMAPAFSDHAVRWVSTVDCLGGSIPFGDFASVRDASMWDKPGLPVMAVQMLWQVLRLRPDVVITTGAAPGYFAVVFGRLLGARTIWVDSMANSEELSLAGKRARRWAHHWLTQWPELAHDQGPRYIGSVL